MFIYAGCNLHSFTSQCQIPRNQNLTLILISSWILKNKRINKCIFLTLRSILFNYLDQKHNNKMKMSVKVSKLKMPTSNCSSSSDDVPFHWAIETLVVYFEWSWKIKWFPCVLLIQIGSAALIRLLLASISVNSPECDASSRGPHLMLLWACF